MGVASLVLGILTIVFCFIPGIGIISPILGIIGIILGSSAKETEPGNAINVAGLVCSTIGTILSLIGFIACVGCISATGFTLSDIIRQIR